MVSASQIPTGYDLVFKSSTANTLIGNPASIQAGGNIRSHLKPPAQRPASKIELNLRLKNNSGKSSIGVRYLAKLNRPKLSVTLKPLPSAKAQKITSMPGFEGVQLPVSPKIMPTAMVS